MKRRAIIGFVVALSLAPTNAHGDDVVPDMARPVRLLTPSVCTTDGGTVVRFPSGVRVLAPELWITLDSEVRRLQDTATRAAAEKAVLVKASDPTSHFLTYIAVAGTAFAAGMALAAVR